MVVGWRSVLIELLVDYRVAADDLDDLVAGGSDGLVRGELALAAEVERDGLAEDDSVGVVARAVVGRGLGGGLGARGGGLVAVEGGGLGLDPLQEQELLRLCSRYFLRVVGRYVFSGRGRGCAFIIRLCKNTRTNRLVVREYRNFENDFRN